MHAFYMENLWWCVPGMLKSLVNSVEATAVTQGSHHWEAL